MSLNISTNKNITNDTVVNKYLKKFSFLGDKIFSNSKFGTSNNIDAFEYIRSKRLFNLLDNTELGIGNCGNSKVNIYEKNNEWFNCCNIEEKGICFDGENFRDLSAERSIIEEYKKSGWIYKKTENCKLYFERTIPAIPNFTDIHTYLDTTSMLLADAEVAVEALNNWFLGIKAANPSYEGNLYIIPISRSLSTTPPPDYALNNLAERWLRHASLSYEGTPYIEPTWSALADLPPNYTTSSYVPPDDLIILSFIDECAPSSTSLVNTTDFTYHSLTFPDFGTGVDPSPLEPTNAFNYDLGVFLSVYDNFSSFRQILYPIPRFSGSQYEATMHNVLTMVAAVKARILTTLEITELDSSVDLSLLEIQNPYTIPLESYNIDGVWSKSSPASEVFNNETFGEELSLVLQFNTPTVQMVDSLLPIKKMSEPVFTYSNRWDLLDTEYKKCMCSGEILPKLYKMSIK